MRQLYEIGEQVIRQATTYTSYNGEYKIIGVISAGEMKKLHPFMAVLDQPYYELDGLDILTDRGTISNHTGQAFLRKIHKPSTQSFTELITNLTTKIVEKI